MFRVNLIPKSTLLVAVTLFALYLTDVLIIGTLQAHTEAWPALPMTFSVFISDLSISDYSPFIYLVTMIVTTNIFLTIQNKNSCT